MTRHLHLFLYSSIAIAFCGVRAQAGLMTLTPDPASGEVSGVAGSTVGWGSTITNTSGQDYLGISKTDFCPGGELDFLGCPAQGQPNLGTYTDALSTDANYNFLSPSQTETLPADGLGSFVINPLLTPGIYTGVLVVYYDVYDSDFNQLFSENVTASASIDVVSSDSVPEPGTIMLLLPALGMLGYKRRREILFERQ